MRVVGSKRKSRETGNERETDAEEEDKRGREALPISVWSTAKCTDQSDGNTVCTPVQTSWPTLPASVAASPPDTPTDSQARI